MAEAARIVGITPRQMRRLVESGRVGKFGTVGQAMLLDPVSVEQLARAARAAGRPWGWVTAWVVIHELSGTGDLAAAFSQGHSRSRARAHLRQVSDARHLLELCRGRASVSQWAAPMDVVAEAGRYVAASRIHALARGQYGEVFNLTVGEPQCDGYLDQDTAAQLVAGFALVADPAGPVTFRAVADEAVVPGEVAPVAAVAMDLMESARSRERAEGSAVLTDLLGRWRAA